MLKIRLQREGRKNDPAFRVVVTEHTRGTKSQKHVDRVGFYHPKTKDQHLNEDRIKHWLSVGAQASGTVHNMLVKAGIIKADTVNVLPKKTPIVTEKPEEEVVSAPVAEVAADETPAKEEVVETPVEEAAPVEEAPTDEPAAEEEAPEAPATKEETPADEEAKPVE